MYTYNDLLADMRHLAARGADISFIGTTAAGRAIPCAHVGRKTGPQIIIQGAIHAREHVTAKLVVQMAYYFQEVYCLNGICGGGSLLYPSSVNLNNASRNMSRAGGFRTMGGCNGLGGANACNLSGGVYFVPMVNIDGACLCQLGLASVQDACTRQFLCSVNGGSTDFTMWKANLNAVDLNTNFAARWGTGAQNVFQPAPANYVGPYANSEPETRCLICLTQNVKPAMTISYHAKGHEIYWEFHQPAEAKVRDRSIGQRFAEETGYRLVDGDLGSAGGYKDWCIQEHGIPAYTFEIVDPAVPYPISYSVLKDEFPRNKNIPRIALDMV